MLLLVAVALSSCREVSRHRALRDLWTYIDAAPDSALRVLEALPSEHFLLPGDRADYALLKSIALDKNYIDVTDDSLARVATDWYDVHGRPERKLRAWYYLGRVQQNAGNPSGAIVSFQKARQLAETSGDLFYEGMACRAMGDVYRDAFFEEEALESMQRAYECFIASEHPLHADYALLDIARRLSALSQQEESEAAFLQVIDHALECDNAALLSTARQSYAYMLSVYSTDYQKIINLLDATKVDSTSTTSILCAMAIAYDGLGQEEKARQWLHMAESLSSDTFDRAVVASEAFRIERRHHNDAQALCQLKLSSDAQDSLFTRVLNQSVIVAQRDAYQSSYLLSEQQNEKKVLGLWLTIIALLSCLCLFFLYRKKSSLEKENAVYQITSLRDEIQRMTILSSEKDRMIVRLFQNHLHLVNDFSDTYLGQEDGQPDSEKRIIQHIQKQIDSLTSDNSFLQELESIVNYTCENVMELLRKEVKLKTNQYELLCCFFAGLSGNATRLLSGETRSNIYTSKHRLQATIKQQNPPHLSLFLKYLSS